MNHESELPPLTSMPRRNAVLPRASIAFPRFQARAAAADSRELRARLVEAERQELVSAIERAHGNKSRAARLLKVSRKTLYARLHRHGLALETEVS
jgi:DNA-binding NtrC family response regulator